MSIHPLYAAFTACCPRCGKGRLFSGLLAIAPRCNACDLLLQAQDSGDGPVFFALVIVGFLAVGLAGFLEVKYEPPYWLQAVIFIPFTIIACIVFMRFFKAWLIAMQFKHNPDSFS